MKALIILVFGLILVSGCATSPLCSTGCVSEHVSSFDGMKEVLMTPGYVYRSNKGISGSDMRIGAYWSETLRDESIILIVMPHKDKPSASGSKMSFNVNGELTVLFSVKKQEIPNFSPSTSSATYFNPRVIEGMNVQYFLVNQTFINTILNSVDVRIRIDLMNTHLEGIFSHNSTAAAKQSFIEFMQKVDEAKKRS